MNIICDHIELTWWHVVSLEATPCPNLSPHIAGSRKTTVMGTPLGIPINKFTVNSSENDLSGHMGLVGFLNKIFFVLLYIY